MHRHPLMIALVFGVTFVSAQGPEPDTPLPAFEVASVKPNASGSDRASLARPRGSLSISNMPLRTIIAQAFGIPPELQRFVVAGGPEALLSARFDINAKLPEAAPDDQHLVMLRRLLAERFALRTHRDTRPVPVYALTVTEDGVLGPELRSSSIDCTAARARVRAANQRFEAGNAPRDAKNRPVCWGTSRFGTPGAQTVTGAGPLSDLVRSVQAFADRPVIDATGLTGTFEWHLMFAWGQTPNPDFPGLFTAIDEQLGLKLDARTGPVEQLVIDHLETPTPD